MSKLGMVFMYLIAIAILFFVFSAILMATWNYTIPRLINSINQTDTYEDISYTTAMVFAILIITLSGGTMAHNTTVFVMECASGEKNTEKSESKKSRRTNLGSYSGASRSFR